VDLIQWLDQHGGIAHVDDALRAGFTRHRIRHAVASRLVRRIRRSWICIPQAPALLKRAASISGRVACVSAARHHELWTLADDDNSEVRDRAHLSVRPNASRFDAGDAVVHWNSGPEAVSRFDLVEPVANALVQIADCRPFDHAVATWESAIRRGHVRREFLERLPLRTEASRRVLTASSELSDSGIESLPLARLRRIGVEPRQQVPLLGHRVDGLIGDRLVYQVDGYEFHRSSEQRRSDLAHDRTLVLAGYTVLRFDYADVVFGWPAIEAQIRGAMAVGLHRAA
jgi:very-short-patch-repair endonuclease